MKDKGKELLVELGAEVLVEAVVHMCKNKKNKKNDNKENEKVVIDYNEVDNEKNNKEDVEMERDLKEKIVDLVVENVNVDLIKGAGHFVYGLANVGVEKVKCCIYEYKKQKENEEFERKCVQRFNNVIYDRLVKAELLDTDEDEEIYENVINLNNYRNK